MPQAVIYHPSLRLEWKFIKLPNVLEESVCWEKQTNKLFQNHLRWALHTSQFALTSAEAELSIPPNTPKICLRKLAHSFLLFYDSTCVCRNTINTPRFCICPFKNVPVGELLGHSLNWAPDEGVPREHRQIVCICVSHMTRTGGATLGSYKGQQQEGEHLLGWDCI